MQNLWRIIRWTLSAIVAFGITITAMIKLDIDTIPFPWGPLVVALILGTYLLATNWLLQRVGRELQALPAKSSTLTRNVWRKTWRYQTGVIAFGISLLALSTIILRALR